MKDKEKPVHTCFLNWKKASTCMEADGVLQGFSNSVEKIALIWVTVIVQLQNFANIKMTIILVFSIPRENNHFSRITNDGFSDAEPQFPLPSVDDDGRCRLRELQQQTAFPSFKVHAHGAPHGTITTLSSVARRHM
ncbi:hypothetical protein QTP88_021204 [Uroleucon formosanum]